MAHDAAVGPAGKLVIRNIGLMLSGALERPILDADAIVAVDGKIAAIGRLKDLDVEGAATIVDAHGAALAPEGGLAGWNMPGVSNTPQGLLFEQTNHPAAGV